MSQLPLEGEGQAGRGPAGAQAQGTPQLGGFPTASVPQMPQQQQQQPQQQFTQGGLQDLPGQQQVLAYALQQAQRQQQAGFTGVQAQSNSLLNLGLAGQQNLAALLNLQQQQQQQGRGPMQGGVPDSGAPLQGVPDAAGYQQAGQGMPASAVSDLRALLARSMAGGSQQQGFPQQQGLQAPPPPQSLFAPFSQQQGMYAPQRQQGLQGQGLSQAPNLASPWQSSQGMGQGISQAPQQQPGLFGQAPQQQQTPPQQQGLYFSHAPQQQGLYGQAPPQQGLFPQPSAQQPQAQQQGGLAGLQGGQQARQHPLASSLYGLPPGQGQPLPTQHQQASLAYVLQGAQQGQQQGQPPHPGQALPQQPQPTPQVGEPAVTALRRMWGARNLLGVVLFARSPANVSSHSWCLHVRPDCRQYKHAEVFKSAPGVEAVQYT